MIKDTANSEYVAERRSEGQLAGRVALITGASRGLGAALARRFAHEGAQLVLLARTVGALEEVDDEIRASGGRQALLVPHDLRDFDALDQLGASLHQRYGKLDVLVGNAGHLGSLSPIGHTDPKVWAETLDVNLTANFRLLRSLDPLLRLSDAGRAIFVGAEEARASKAYWGPYAASKAALESLVLTYAAEIERTTVRANLICPGPMATKLRAQAFPGEKPDTVLQPDDVTDRFVELASQQNLLNGQRIVVAN